LLVAVVLFGTLSSFAQPVIQVPADCTVVVAGTGAGAITGPGGKVGRGGIITMPDPYDKPSPDGDFTFIANGNTLVKWKLFGDLSKTTANLPPAAGIYNEGAVSPLNIESYNKILRFAENPSITQPLLNTKWGRSKGKVEVYFTSFCGSDIISFDVYKTYTSIAPSAIPIIIGPDCLKANTTYTYSVDQIASDNANEAIGFDRYIWSGIPVMTYYSSADNSSITFTTGGVVTQFTLSCCFGRANPWDTAGEFTTPAASSTTCITKLIGVQPTAPTFTSATTTPPSCLDTGATSFNVALNTIPGYTYSWATTGTSWQLVPGGTPLGATLAVNSVDNNPGKLILTVTNTTVTGCLPVTFEYPINRNFKDPTVRIGGASNCLLAGSTTNNFFIESNASLNPTTWSLPVGWSITSGSANGTNSNINITVPTTGTGSTAGSYTITAKSDNCPGIISRTVFVKPGLPAFTTTTPTCVTKGTTAVPAPGIAVTPITGVPANGYTWTYLVGTQPSGWTCTANCNTANPTVIPSGTIGGTVTGPVTVTVTATSGTGCSTSATKTINYNPVGPTGVTAGCLTVGVAGTTTITVNNAPSPFYGGYTIVSALPAFVTGYSVNATTGVITLNTTAASVPGSYAFTITHTTTSCGSSTGGGTAVFTDNGAVFNAATIAGSSFDPIIGNCDDYTIINQPVGSAILWFLNGSTTALVANNTTIFISPSGNKLSLCGSGVAPTAVVARVTTPTGCVKILTAPLRGSHSSRQTATSGGTKNIIEGITVYPNPTTGLFTIKLDKVRLLATATLNDATGKEIATYILKKGENKIEKEGLPSGIYSIILEVDGKTETRQLIIK
jgi:Secretion system C-terminal sorting domain